MKLELTAPAVMKAHVDLTPEMGVLAVVQTPDARGDGDALLVEQLRSSPRGGTQQTILIATVTAHHHVLTLTLMAQR